MPLRLQRLLHGRGAVRLVATASALALAPMVGLACGADQPADAPEPPCQAVCDDAAGGDGRAAEVGDGGGIVANDGAPPANRDAETCPGAGVPGTLDTKFGAAGIARFVNGTRSETVAVQADGKLLIGGINPVATEERATLMRLLPTGAVDTSFGTAGLVESRTPGVYQSTTAIAVQPDGKIVTAGRYTSQFFVRRYLANGAPDPMFADSGTALISFAPRAAAPQALTVLADGRILVGGAATTQPSIALDAAFARLNADGSLDTTFGADGNGKLIVDVRGTRDAVQHLLPRADGSVVVAVTASSLYAVPGQKFDFGLLGLTSTGAIDSAFATGGKYLVPSPGPTDGSSYVTSATAVDASGRLLMAGPYADRTAIVRFSSAGVPDTTFGGGAVATSSPFSVDTIRVDADGRAFVAGTRTRSPGVNELDMVMARRIASGGPDTTFGGPSGEITAELPQSFRGATTMAEPCSVLVIGHFYLAAFGTEQAVLRFHR